jgi:putative Mn2+ efflux pump MntP
MIYEAFAEKEKAECTNLNLKSLLTLSVATSIDALAVGISFAMISGSIGFPAFMIGLVSFGMALIGGNLGKHAASRFSGKGAEILGGLVLIGIGIKILLEHIGG